MVSCSGTENQQQVVTSRLFALATNYRKKNAVCQTVGRWTSKNDCLLDPRIINKIGKTGTVQRNRTACAKILEKGGV
jgi:hypothetical protein